MLRSSFSSLQDVYKRQEQTGAIVLDFNFENAKYYVSPRMGMFACGTLDPLTMMKSKEEAAVHPQDMPALKRMRDRFAAVSYTHLDVYKRQW